MMGNNSNSIQPIPDLDFLRYKSRQLRATCIQMAHDGKECHLNGALSCIDILVALYYTWLKVDPQVPKDEYRDRLVFSKGHACTALYAVLVDRGLIPMKWLSQYATNDSPLPSHPCKISLPILESSSGSLGHGLGIATGISYGLRLKINPARTVAVLSDGECNEGSTWEAAMFAAANHLDNLLAIVDYNGIQSVGRTDILNGGASFAEKFRAFGWVVREVDGLDIAAIQQELAEVPFERGRPSAIIAKTRAGAGVSFMEDQVLWHYRTPSDDDLRNAFFELNAQPIHMEFGK